MGEESTDKEDLKVESQEQSKEIALSEEEKNLIQVETITNNETTQISEYKILDPSRIELLDHFLNFLETDEPLNYVLASYFAKFLTLLINKNSTKVIYFI